MGSSKLHGVKVAIPILTLIKGTIFCNIIAFDLVSSSCWHTKDMQVKIFVEYIYIRI